MALWRNRLALVKAESTYNTNPTPAATDALLFTELDVEPLSLELIAVSYTHLTLPTKRIV